MTPTSPTPSGGHYIPPARRDASRNLVNIRNQHILLYVVGLRLKIIKKLNIKFTRFYNFMAYMGSAYSLKITKKSN